MIDVHQRNFKNLRISLLDSCNFACVYCTDEDNLANIKKSQLSLSQLLETIKKLHQELDLESIRLTGGEPLLYPNLADLIKGLVKLGIPKIKMTSNAFLLAAKAEKLRDAGLQEINISLDAAEDAAFFKMTKRDKLQEVIHGIDTALSLGIKVKLNAVVMKNVNHQQIIPLLKFAEKRPISIRFLEVMAMGHLHQQKENYLFSQQEILDTVAQFYQFKELPRKTSATANYWQTNTGLKFGIIANSSAPFCADCNRLRLDHQGNIYGCLSVNEPISIGLNQTDKSLKQSLQQAMQQKQTLKFKGSKLSMLQIGG